MRILRFEFHDAVRGWTLEPMQLDAFNLLVGVSGAGKTRIVRAIERVCELALGAKDEGDEAEETWCARFAIDFEHEGVSYSWAAELEEPAEERGHGSSPRGTSARPLIRTERIMQGEQVLVERTPERFLFSGAVIPRLDRSSSAIAILKEEPIMAPLHVAFSRCVFQMLESLPSQDSRLQQGFEEDRERYRDVTDLGADLSMSLHRKAELFQEMFPDRFSEILESFREAFPSVEQLRVVRFNFFQARPKYDPSRSDVGVGRFLYAITLVLREAGVANWVPFHEMSSGMQRYLSFLIHLSFAPRGTVVLIDELESSLGLNCLPAATRFLLGRAPDLQLILTSHHPYIIEQIPPSHWKIVTRKGSHVRVLDAAKILALEEDRSHLDRFTRLINLPEYEQGIQG